MRSGWYILGPEVEAFENEFASYVGRKYCVGVNSGLDALTLSINVLGIGVGDEVVVNHYWYTCADGSHPNIRQAVAVNEIVLLNGDPSNSVPGISAQWMPVARLRCL